MYVLSRISIWVTLWTCLAVTVGCGDSHRASVSGRVTLDGKEIEDGTIHFLPTHGNAGVSAWGSIKSGSYAIPAKQGPSPGTCRVEIHWSRKTGRKTRYDPKMDEYKEAVPLRYNRDSELKFDVKPGKNQADFQLTSKHQGTKP